MLTNAPKGTKDMMPDQAYKWHYIEEAFAKSAGLTGLKKSERRYLNTLSCFSEAWRHDGYRQKEMYSFRITANGTLR